MRRVLARWSSLLALAVAPALGRRARRWWSAPPRTSCSRPTVAAAKAQMDAAPSSPASTRSGSPRSGRAAQTAPTRGRADRAAQRRPAPRSSTAIRVYLSIYPDGLERDAARRAEARATSPRTPPTLAQQLPSVHDFIVGNEPNLNRFWLPQFDPNGEDAAAPAYTALLAQTYDALKAVDPAITRLGGALAPRGDRPARHRPRHALADRVHHRPGRRLPGERPDDADHGRVRLPPVRRQLERSPPTSPHPNSTTIGLADYDKLVAPARRRRSTARPSPARRCRSSTTSSASRRQIPAGEGAALHRHRAGDDEARSTRRRRRVLHAGARSSRSASRT